MNRIKKHIKVNTLNFKFIIFLIFLFFYKNTLAQFSVEHKIFTNSNRTLTKSFGSSVDISGDVAVVGAPSAIQEDINGNTIMQSGLVFVFENNTNGEYIQTATLASSDFNMNFDKFGFSVATNGNLILVGSIMNGTKGAAYIFQKDNQGNWNEIIKLTSPNISNNAFFGNSVIITQNYAFVGAKHHSNSQNGLKIHSGAVVIFKKDSNGIWNEFQKLEAEDVAAQANFGSSLAIYNNTLVIGADQSEEMDSNNSPVQLAGSVYIFDKNNLGQWMQSQKITPPEITSVNFGKSVAVYENDLIIGSPTESQRLINGNVTKFLPRISFYNRNNNLWTFHQQIIDTIQIVNGINLNHATIFGYDVDMENDIALVSNHAQGVLEPNNTLIDQIGTAKIYKKNNSGDWVFNEEIMASDYYQDDQFSKSLTISNGKIIIGTPFKHENNLVNDFGAAYIFEQNILNVTEQNAKGHVIYPNPATTTVKIQTEKTLKDIYIYDLSGKIVKKIKGNIKQIDISKLDKGIYIITINTGEHQYVNKLWKK